MKESKIITVNKQRIFVSGGIYHIYNRGIEKRTIFLNRSFYRHFTETLVYYKEEQPLRLSFHLKGEKPLKQPRETVVSLVSILAYCLMPNHFHLIVRQNIEDGIRKFMALSLNSYTKYFNTRQKRVGPLFQGTFKAKPIENAESFLQVTRYIHLNPVELVPADTERGQFLRNYPYSSYLSFIDPKREDILCRRADVSGIAGDLKNYSNFVESKIRSDSSLGIETLILD